MKRSVLSSLATLVIAAAGMAQQAHWCETDRRLAEAMASSPEFRQQYIEFQQEIRELMAYAATQRDREQEYIIPVVFHILHLQGEENISNEQVLDAMAILNRDYAKQNADTADVHPAFHSRIANMRIQFRLATKDPQGNCTNGIVRYQSTEALRGESTSKLRPWPRNRYMNVYIVRQILSGAAGYFTYGPWPVLDGIVLLHDYTGSTGSAAGISFTSSLGRSRALTHEVGHYLSLAHVWGENNGVPDANIPPGSCQMQALCGDDGVYDTPNTKGWSCCPLPNNPGFPNRPWGDCDRQSFRAYHGRAIPPIPAVPVRYDFDQVTTSSGTTDPSPVPAVRDSLDSTAVRIPLTAMQAIGVSANSTQNGAFAFSSWGLGATDGDNDYGSLAGSLDLGRYYQFFINPPVTHQINFRGVTFKAGRNGSGPRTFAVRSSRDNFTTNIALASSNGDVVIQPGNVAFFANDSATSSTVITVNPAGTFFPTQETPFTLRIYAFNSEEVGGAFSIDSLVVLGRSGTIENIENYMEYSYCSKMFTIGQGERARAALQSPTFERDNLWSQENLIVTGVADGHQQTCAPVADFYAQMNFATPGSPTVPFPPTTCVNQNVRFMDNSQRAQPTSWSWTFQDGNPATSSQRNPVVQFTSRGWKTVSLTVANAVGSSSVTKEYAVYVGQPNGEWGPYMENFEGQQGDDLFPLFAMNYENNHTYWRRHVGGGYSGNACARLNSGDRNQLDLIRPDNEGDYDELISPQLSLTGAPLSTLSFRWAYSTGTNTVANITERLVVDYSSDCGRTWTSLGANGIITGTALITNGNVDVMPPPPAQWRQRTFNLAGAMMGSSIRFRFRFISSAYSRDLYIDDIQFGSTAVGLGEWLSENFIQIFPNPANDQFTLQVFGMHREATEVTVTDMRGAVVYQNKFQPMGDAMIELSAQAMGLSDGMYLVQASNSQGRSAQKLVVGR